MRSTAKRQFGNGVPVTLARSVARELVRNEASLTVPKSMADALQVQGPEHRPETGLEPRNAKGCETHIGKWFIPLPVRTHKRTILSSRPQKAGYWMPTKRGEPHLEGNGYSLGARGSFPRRYFGGSGNNGELGDTWTRLLDRRNATIGLLLGCVNDRGPRRLFSRSVC